MQYSLVSVVCVAFQCFTCGAEAGIHRRNHRYQIIVSFVVAANLVFADFVLPEKCVNTTKAF